MKILTILLIALSFFSCSQKKKEKKKVKVQAQIRMAALSGYGGGGILVGTNGPESFTYFLDQNSVTIELPNGVWDFVVMGWSGGGGTFSGSMLCDVKRAIGLDGVEASLEFNLASAKCNTNILGPSFSRDGSGQPHVLHFNSCANWQGMIAEEWPFDLWATDNIAYCDDTEGKEISFKLRLFQNKLSNNPWSVREQPVETICLGDRTLGAGSLFSSTNVRWPMIDPGFARVPFEIIAYDGANCTGSTNIIEFRDGSGAPAHNNFGLFMAGSGKVGAHLHSNLCEGTFLTNAPFANHVSPDPLVGNKEYLICTPDQLQAVADNWSSLFALSDVSFRLGKNLDLSTGFTGPIGNSGMPFNANFEGNDYILSNWVYGGSDSDAGIFGVVGEAEISHLTLANFSMIPTGTSQNVGALFGSLENAALKRTEISEITIKNSTLSCSNCNRLGGLGGTVEITMADRSIEFRDIDLEGMFINGGTPGGSASIDVGGVLGRFTSASQNNLRATGIHFHGKAQGHSHVGGFTSLMKFSELEGCSISSYDEVTAGDGTFVNFIEGHEFVGGIAAETWSNSRVSKCEVNAQVKVGGADGDPSSAITTRLYIGGGFGYIQGGVFSDISVDVDISSILTDDTSNLGGFAGKEWNNTCIEYSEFYNISVISSIDVNGDIIGGAFGTYECGEGKNIFVESLIEVKFQDDILNEKRGLFAGFVAGNAVAKQLLLEGDVTGSNVVGALAGKNQGNLTEVYIKPGSTVYCDHSNASTGIAGGVVGENGISGGNELLKDIISYVDVIYTHTNNPSNGGKYAGKNTSSDPTKNKNIILLGTLQNGGGSADITTECGTFDSNCSAFNSTPDHLHNTIQTFAGDFSSPIWMDDSGNAKLSFFAAWDSFDSTISGNFFNPFHIANCHDWNKIQNNEILMLKSYILDQDIFFDDAGCPAFVPIGGDHTQTPTKFLGNIISNQKWLRNISVTIPTNVFHPYGIIRILGDENSSIRPYIGEWKEPLVVKNVEFNAGSNEISYGFGVVVGKMENGEISAHVEYGDLVAGGTCGGSCTQGVGGVVGNIVSGTLSNSSSRFGTIDMSAGVYDNVGGLVGYIRPTSLMEARVSFYETMSDATILASSNIGGLIGGISSTGSNGSKVEINDSYYFNATADSLIANSGIKSGAFIGRIISESDAHNASVDINNSYAFANLTSDGTKAIEDAINVGGVNNIEIDLQTNFYYSTAGGATTAQSFTEATINGGNTFIPHISQDNLFNAISSNLDEERFSMDPNTKRAYLYFEKEGYYFDHD